MTLSISDASGNSSTKDITVNVVDYATADDEKTTVTNEDDYTVLINKYNALEEGYSPDDLAYITDGYMLREEAAEAFLALVADAEADGLTINVISAYRSEDYQTYLYESYMESDPENAPYYSAYPRTSEHELGLAVDISYDYELHDDLQESELGQWMAEHAAEYGFIVRYPSDKTNLTGYYYEAWHYRYVGVELATYLMENDLTLEEFYQ